MAKSEFVRTAIRTERKREASAEKNTGLLEVEKERSHGEKER